jgi:hypothetical protein
MVTSKVRDGEPIGFALTTEEVVAICDGLGIAPHHVLTEDAPYPLPPPLDSAVRGLFARGIVKVESERPVIDAALARAMRVAAAPRLLARVVFDVDGMRGALHLAARPELAIERRLVAPDVHRFVSIPGDQVLMHLRQVAGLDIDLPVPRVEPLRISLATLVAVGQHMAMGDAARAADVLEGAGQAAASVKAYVSALQSRTRAIAVSILYADEGSAVRGTVTAWVEAGNDGRWRLEPPDPFLFGDDPAHVGDAALTTELTVGPVSADELVRDILAGLPA